MTVKSDLLDIVESAVAMYGIPVVREIFLPDPHPSPDKNAEFGIVILEDGAAGLYYAWLGEAQSGMQGRYAVNEFKGVPAMQLVALYRSEHPSDCSLGLAAINAISRSIYRRTAYTREAASNSIGGLEFEQDDHVGMIGYFPSLVRKLREQKINLTVVEKKTKFLEQDDLFRVVLEPECLQDCNKIISTASTLLNNSIDDILLHMQSASDVVVIGPTAGFFPDPLFARGVTAIGGTEIIDADVALARIRADQRMGDASRKFLVHRNHYPGIQSLLKSGPVSDERNSLVRKGA